MANTQTSPLDATGRAQEAASKKRAKELKDRENEISLANAAEQISNERDVFDPKHPDAPLVLDEIVNVGVTTADNSVIIRTIVDIDDMTYGVGNTYTFKAGKKYKVSKGLANYLERLGYIWRPN